VAIAITPASGAITAKLTTCRINVTDQAPNRGPDNTGGEFAYYLHFSCAGVDDATSYVFNVSADGDHEFNSFVFPAAGVWVLDLVDAHDDSVVEHIDVTVA
jgi:hypothetical protein